jgi:hypothetical protein
VEAHGAHPTSHSKPQTREGNFSKSKSEKSPKIYDKKSDLLTMFCTQNPRKSLRDTWDKKKKIWKSSGRTKGGDFARTPRSKPGGGALGLAILVLASFRSTPEVSSTA